MKEMERSLGVTSVVAIALSAMLGTGVFILPGLAADMTGSSVWLAFLLAAACTFPAASAKAEMATAMPTSGGAFVFLDRSFGPWVGTIVGISVWLAALLKASFALMGVSVYLVLVWEVPIRGTALTLLAMIVLMNWVGVKAVSRAQMFVMGALLLFIGALVVLTLGTVTGSPEQSPRLELGGGVLGMFTAVGLLTVGFNGVTKVAAIAEEVHNPEKTIPWGIFTALGIAAAVYALVAKMLALSLPPETFAGDLHPISTWAQIVGGSTWAKVASLFGVVTLVSFANTGLLAASRFPFAMSRDSLLPAVLQGISPRFKTPAASIFVTGSAMAAAIAILDVAKLAKLASAVVIATYVLNCLAVIAFRESRVGWYRPKFKSPLYPWVPAFGVLSGVGLILQLGSVALWAGLLAAVPGSLLFLVYGRRRVTRRGVVLQRGRRAELLREARERHQKTGSQKIRVEGDTVAQTLRSDSLKDFGDSTPPSFSMRSTEDSELGGEITGRARAVVAMFGDERAPETLAEIGAALSGWGRLPVVHLTEVPEQTILGAMGAEPALISLRRRLRVMAEEEGAQLEFHTVNSRDIVRTIHSVSSRVECDFLVMRWRGRSRWAFMPYNPLGWLVDHLDCNLALFRDSGVRYIREILVYAEPGPHDALAVGTADDLARRWGARITLIRPISTAASVSKRDAEMAYLSELSELCEATTRTHLVQGDDPVAAVISEATSYDLLVMGLPQASWAERVRGTRVERIARKVASSVLMLKTPRVRTHEAFVRKREALPTELIHFVNEDAVKARVKVGRKEALFESVADAFAKMLKVEAKHILDALWERERTQNTSVGHGVALPHATLEAASSTVVGVFTLVEPINYHGPDGEKVDVVFVIVSPPSERQRHLELLSTIARLAMSTPMLQQLREAETVPQLLRVIHENEQSQSAMPALEE